MPKDCLKETAELVLLLKHKASFTQLRKKQVDKICFLHDVINIGY